MATKHVSSSSPWHYNRKVLLSYSKRSINCPLTPITRIFFVPFLQTAFNGNKKNASYRLNVSLDIIRTHEQLLTLCFITLIFPHSQMEFLTTVAAGPLVEVLFAETVKGESLLQ